MNRILLCLVTAFLFGSAVYAQPSELSPVPMIPEIDTKVRAFSPSRALDRLATNRSLPLDGRFAAPNTGAGVVVVILDGMPAESDEFGTRVIERRDFVNKPGSCEPGDPHGSRVASIVAGRDYGVAPGAHFLFYCVLDSESNLISYTAWAEAMEEVIAYKNAHPSIPVIANFSFGGPSDPYVDPYIAQAKAAGIVLVSSAGNGSVDACNHWPSMETFAVGATDDTDNQVDKPAWFTNWGTCVDIMAPGRFVDSAFGVDSGTSVAAPLVAGLLAVKAVQNPGMSAEGLMQAVLADASNGVIQGLQANTPNKLAFIPEVQAASCVPDLYTMCLGAGARFKVEVTWRDYSNNTGAGKVFPVAGATDSGLFYFFSANNWEVMVKVLDGCVINQRFWVFYAATTDVEFSVTVTDTRTGAVWQGHNGLGQAAVSKSDTSAFATCN